MFFKTSEDRSNILPAANSFEPPRGKKKENIVMILNKLIEFLIILEHVDDPKPSMGGFKLFLMLLFGVLGVCALGVIGIMFYQKQQEQSRKRFY